LDIDTEWDLWLAESMINYMKQSDTNISQEMIE